MKNEVKKKINKGFRSVIGGLYVPFPDDVIYTGNQFILIILFNLIILWLFLYFFSSRFKKRSNFWSL